MSADAYGHEDAEERLEEAPEVEDDGEAEEETSSRRQIGTMGMALVQEKSDGTTHYVMPGDQPEFRRIEEVEEYIKEQIKEADTTEVHVAVVHVKREYKVKKKVETTISFDEA